MVVVNVHLASGAGIGRVSPGTAGMVWVGLTAGTGKIETWLIAYAWHGTTLLILSTENSKID